MKISKYIKKRKLLVDAIKERHLDLGEDGGCDLIHLLSQNSVKEIEHEGTRYVEDGNWDTERLMSELVSDVHNVDRAVRNLSRFLDELDVMDFADEYGTLNLTFDLSKR